MSEIRVTEKGISINDKEETVPRFHFFHKWTEWKKVREGNLSVWSIIGQTDIVTARYIDQERSCIVCGKIQAREVRI